MDAPTMRLKPDKTEVAVLLRWEGPGLGLAHPGGGDSVSSMQIKLRALYSPSPHSLPFLLVPLMSRCPGHNWLHFA